MDVIPAYHDQVRPDALAYLPEKVGRVLDFGGGIGPTAAALRASGRASHAMLFDQVADHALPGIDAAEAVDFDDVAAVARVGGQHAPFDTILALDVLEHLRYPWEVVAALKTCLAPGGRLLISVPNLACHRIMRSILIHDRFDYVASGLLDRTHIRWFTRSTAIELATGAGLQLEWVRTNLMTPRDRWIDKVTFGLFQRFIAQQWLILARNPG